MSILKKQIANIILILFEIFVGILLLINPTAFTKAVIIFFGIVLMIIGLVYLIKFLVDKKHDDESVLTLVWAGLSILFGAFAAFAAPFIITLFIFVLVMYALIMEISGGIKLYSYIMAKKNGDAVSVLMLISAVISILLGIVIVVNPFGTAKLIWTFIAIAILFEAAIDLAALILAAVVRKSVNRVD